jgi:hypothetical protein
MTLSRSLGRFLPCLFIAVTASGAVSYSACSQEADAALGGTDGRAAGIDSFSLVWNRNIFDRNRRSEQPAVEVHVTMAPDPMDKVQLTGVLLVADEQVAFFEGTKPAYNTHGTVGETVGDLKLERVEIDEVEFSTEDQKLILPVGAVAVKQTEGVWHISQGESLTVFRAPAAEPSSGSGEAAPGEGGNLLERLKARRKQELGQ